MHLKFPTFLWGSVSISSFHFFLCISRLHISIDLSPNSHILSSGSSCPLLVLLINFWVNYYTFYSRISIWVYSSYSNKNIFIISNLKFCFWHLDPLIGNFFFAFFSCILLLLFIFPIMDQTDASSHVSYIVVAFVVENIIYTIGTLHTDFPMSFSGVCLCYCLFVLWLN